MDSALVEVIKLYELRPDPLRLEIGLALIRDGALTRKEEDRLYEVLTERRRQRKKAQGPRLAR